jgi:molybdopterin-guanine dinucleotide biosynthesis protein A
MPMVDPGLFDFLLSRRSRVDAVIPVHQDEMEPLCGLYNRRIIPLLERKIHEGNYSMQHLIRAARNRLVKTGPELDFYSDHMFANMNTAADIHLFSMK